jgi:EAL and modified HD-GYP domain-containing signal transduction protein
LGDFSLNKTINLNYIGRQAILDKNNKIFAYEILYREAIFDNKANIDSNINATAKILINLLTNIGIESVVGNKKAFINVDESILACSLENLISCEKVIFEILENTKVDEQIVDRVKQLKFSGFKFALDDFLMDKETKSLIEYADFIKVDVLNTTETQLQEILELAKKNDVKLLAEKVEDKDTYNRYLELGFEYFQGYFFAKPKIFVNKKLTPYEITLIKIFNELSKSQSDLKKVENFIKSDVKLSFNLLKFINSAFFSFKRKIVSIRHAISILGIEKLRIWITLILYTNEFDSNIESNPLFDLALIRGKMLEELTLKITEDLVYAGEAYLVGTLSLIDVILGQNKEDIIKELYLSEEIENAILYKKGLLGEILTAVELYEVDDFDNLQYILNLHNIGLTDFFKAEEESIKYAEKIKKSLFGDK